jgi:lipoprotein-releasing system permease protein
MIGVVNVKQELLQPGQYNIIIGDQLAGQLAEGTPCDPLRLMVPSASQFTPIGPCPDSTSVYRRSARFHANSEVDGYQMLVNHSGCLTFAALSERQYHRMATVPADKPLDGR